MTPRSWRQLWIPVAEPRGMNHERARRIGLNEAVFRQVNEQLEALADRFSSPGDALDLICECGDARCDQRLVLSRSQYERLRADPVLFAVVPGHVAPDVEDVVGHGPGYEVVRRQAALPTDVAAATDPRRHR